MTAKSAPALQPKSVPYGLDVRTLCLVWQSENIYAVSRIKGLATVSLGDDLAWASKVCASAVHSSRHRSPDLFSNRIPCFKKCEVDGLLQDAYGGRVGGHADAEE